MMATLLLSNTNYYLAGGVFGGSLVVNLYPTLGKFGCILVGFICAATEVCSTCSSSAG
jgi:S-DNA-T family DNA segregation ATPase FtsK/SpoIIIE